MKADNFTNKQKGDYKSLVTTYTETRAGFVDLALEKNRIATPFVEQARSLKLDASKAKSPDDLLRMPKIRSAMLKAAGLSDKAETHLEESDKELAIQNLVDKFLKPAGTGFVEELVYRFLLTKGDTLGGSMRNIGGAWAKRKFASVIVARLRNAGVKIEFLLNSSKQWVDGEQEVNIETIKGISWKTVNKQRTILFDMTVDLVDKKNIDVCLFSLCNVDRDSKAFQNAANYIALGELKGGIDPAGADEHWKTGNSALSRIRKAFASRTIKPKTFFVAAAIEEAMAKEIWGQLQDKTLSSAANLNKREQLDKLCDWLINL